MQRLDWNSIRLHCLRLNGESPGLTATRDEITKNSNLLGLFAGIADYDINELLILSVQIRISGEKKSTRNEAAAE